MAEQEADDPIEKELAEGNLVIEAVRKAVRAALKAHKRAGNPIAVWEDGRVVIVPPEEIPDD